MRYIFFHIHQLISRFLSAPAHLSRLKCVPARQSVPLLSIHAECDETRHHDCTDNLPLKYMEILSYTTTLFLLVLLYVQTRSSMLYFCMCARDCFRLDIFRIMSIIIAECLSYMAARRGTPPRVWFFRVAFLIFYKRMVQIWRITTMFSCLADMSFIPALS